MRIAELDTSVEARSLLCETLKRRSFAVVALDNDASVASREFRVELRKFFELSVEQKQKLGPFRKIGGRMFGYRLDEGEREFVEIRRAPLTKGGVVPAIGESVSCAADAWDTGCNAARKVLKCVVEDAGLNPEAVLRLVDRIPRKKEEEIDEGRIAGLSDAILRACQYSGVDERPILFGAHTDTTFVTIGPVCSSAQEAGLECRDIEQDKWIAVEEELLRLSEEPHDEQLAVIFMGEYMQLLTRQLYRTCEHRVRACQASALRISCPLLLRGRRDEILDPAQLLPVGADPSKTLQLQEPIKVGDLHAFLERIRRKNVEKEQKEEQIQSEELNTE